MSKRPNSVKFSTLRPEFPKKSHSKRKNIFIQRTMKQVEPLLRDFHRKYEIDISDTELRAIARDYATDVSERIRKNRKEILSDRPALNKDHKTLVDDITAAVEAYKPT